VIWKLINYTKGGINEGTEQEAIRNKWVIDAEIPIFTQDKDYINKLIFI
jgi:hypothetical protein